MGLDIDICLSVHGTAWFIWPQVGAPNPSVWCAKLHPYEQEGFYKQQQAVYWQPILIPHYENAHHQIYTLLSSMFGCANISHSNLGNIVVIIENEG